ncbi:hypothetical protein SAMN04487949_0293 [Halogranum gelatinilyticum]|uniref:DUF8108 domain-containing protein n=1 Tax=Halogranum gelatinilyticum TaxID=660521 RepID=A0A1G9PAW7_9EURY|nr:hypothetical protein [Halogranum gelatinilyticum]SDL95367.1 hypothetical protein SAMN04487949_0293 [Halogranum gelatinilyticum]
MDRRLLAALALCATLVVGFLARGLLLSVGRVVLVALALALVGGVAYLVTRQPAYRRSKVGEGTRILKQPVSAAADAHCVECDAAVTDGERRRFVREWVLFGVPLLLLDDGENVYCASCAGEAVDVAEAVAGDVDETTDVLRET